MKNKIHFSILGIVLLTLQIAAQNLQITGITPALNQNNVSRDADITIEFNHSISGTSLNDGSVIVRGRQSGKLSGVYSGGGSAIVTFNPDNDFRPGEFIAVTITTALLSDSGLTLPRGFTYSFTALSGLPPMTPPALAQRNISGSSVQGRDIKALDYDGDGDLDVLAAYEGVTEQLILYENDGDLGFCSFNTGGNFRYVEVYDIDGDGDYDNFGATGAFDTELNWFENEGSFPLTEHIISSEDPWTLTGGDLDSDGDIDVVAAVILPNRVLWFANDGAGNFSSAMPIPTSFSGGSDSHFYIRDINSDGAMDILAFHRDDYNLVWYQNDGNQNFTEILITNTPDRGSLASGDVDGDGDIDIVFVSVENGPTAPFSWFENDGSENFTEHPITATTTGRLYTTNITDVDGDQDMDILAGGYWFENDGSQNFSEHIISAGLGSGINYYTNGINYADMDNDGDMDILTLGFYAISWQENGIFMEITATNPAHATVGAPQDGNIIITFDQPIDMGTVNSDDIRVFSQTKGLAAGTFSGGGNTITFDPTNDFTPGDIIEVSINEKVLSTGGHNLLVTYGFSFQVQTAAVDQPDFMPHSITTHANNPTGMDVADMDGDGDMDLLSCSFSELYWHENDGSGNFITIPIATTGTPIAVFAIDQNEDGYMDIWVDNSGTAASSTLYTNDGNQNFTESSIAVGSIELQQLTDVNNDGDIDILYRLKSNHNIRWADNNCSGYILLGNMPDLDNRSARAGDMDNDGDIDFIAAGAFGPVYYKNDGYFNYVDQNLDDNNTSASFLSDLDGDGDLDALFVETSSAIIWYENRLTGDSLDFGDRQEIAPLNMSPQDVIAVDIDGDGDADVAAVSRNDDKVVWYENRLNEPSGDFGPEQGGASIADGPFRIQSADLNGDDAMDLITLSDNDDELIWFENTGSTDINEHETFVPLVFGLDQNYPNPFNPTTTIEYSLPHSTSVRMTVYDIAGQKVRTLINKPQRVGKKQVTWNGKDDSGKAVASGVYLYRLRAGEFVQIRKMLLLR